MIFRAEPYLLLSLTKHLIVFNETFCEISYFYIKKETVFSYHLCHMITYKLLLIT